MDELMQRVQHRLHSDRLRRGSTVVEASGDERRNPDVEMTGSGLLSGAAEKHLVTKAHESPREQEQKLQGVLQRPSSLGRQNPCKRRQKTRKRDEGPMCHWRLASTRDGDKHGFVRGKTRWATSSSRLATLLSREHAGENRRVRLIGQNETIAGAMYSPRLVNEALRALGKQLVDDGRLDSVSLYSAWTDSRLS